MSVYNGETFPSNGTDGDIELDYQTMKMYLDKAEAKVKELESQKEEFNRAVNFALDVTDSIEGPDLFLRMWREGDWSGIEREFPEWKQSKERDI